MDPIIKAESENVSATFSTLFELFLKRHTSYNSNVVSDKDIKQTCARKQEVACYQELFYIWFTKQDISTFLEYYWAHFPNATILPKMHIMKDHVIPWLQRWHLEVGQMEQQLAESIHIHIMKLERTYQGIANDMDQLNYIFKEHVLEDCSSIGVTKTPPTKKEEAKR